MMRQLSSAFLAFGLVTSAGVAFAKRTPPKPVPPIAANGIRYSVPHGSLMGFVVASDVLTDNEIWKRQIYVVKFNHQVEGDVQACFITDIKIDFGKLVVTNEIGSVYELDLGTLEVHPLKGSLVVQNFPK